MKMKGIIQPLTLAFVSVFVIWGQIQAHAQLRSPVTITCPSPITTECAGPQGTIVQFAVTATSSAGRIVSIVIAPASGSAFPLGTTTVKCTATDSLRNTAECTFTV